MGNIQIPKGEFRRYIQWEGRWRHVYVVSTHYQTRMFEPPDEGDDEYEDLVYDPIMNGVYDKSLCDYIDADIHMVKELKKRGQVR